MRLWLGRPKTRRLNYNIGIIVYDDEGIEVREVVQALSETLEERYPDRLIRAPGIKRILAQDDA